jgi:hypothetical protein
MKILKLVALVASVVAGVSSSTVAAAKVEAQQKKNVTVADFVGTWNIEMMSHQIALVIEAGEGNKVTATMMMMNNDTPLKGELVADTLTLTGVKKEGSEGSAAVIAPNGATEAPPQRMMPPPKPITVTLMEDGTIGGEMMTNQGPVKWTGEKLRTKKKG